MRVKYSFLLIFISWLNLCMLQITFNKATFYKVIMSDDLARINEELSTLDKASDTEAFKGALLMKKSGLLSNAREKLSVFKEGHKQLETAIAKDSTNTEYRFLRLLIQENAPKIVNYNKEIKKDASYLRKNYRTLSSGLQKTIAEYSRKSKELKPEDFKTIMHD